MPASATQVGHNNTDMAICFFLAWLVCLSVTIVSPAKRADPVVMPFGMWTWMGPRNHVLDRDAFSPTGMGNFERGSHV